MCKSDNERDLSMLEPLYSGSPSPSLNFNTSQRFSPSPRVKLFSSSPSLKIRYMAVATADSAQPGDAAGGDSDDQKPRHESIPVSSELTSLAGDGPKSYAEREAVFRKMYGSHFKALMTQLVKSYGLSLSWLDVIQPLIMKATQTVRTDVFAEDIMDINEYVRVKKLPCGSRSDSSLIRGVVCTKNVTHKKMCTNISNPTILLLKCAFDFQRRENQLSSFDTLHLQENKYLQNLVDKVRTFKPKIILVQKSVSRLALEDLYSLNIVVVVNVKPSVMMRVARCTQGEILTSLDQLFFDVRLGTCNNFYLRNFTLESGIKKTLMYFDKCDPKLGCAITLQGGSKRELKKVKKVTQFGLHLAHNSLLESSFLLDEHAWPKDCDTKLLHSPEVDGDYSSSSSTPEFPLYPSLPHPLDALPPAEVVKRLEALGHQVEEEKAEAQPESEEGEGEEFRVPQPEEGGLGQGEAAPESKAKDVETPKAQKGSAGEKEVDFSQVSANVAVKESAESKVEPISPLMQKVDSHSSATSSSNTGSHSNLISHSNSTSRSNSISNTGSQSNITSVVQDTPGQSHSHIEVGMEALPESHATVTSVDPVSAEAAKRLQAIKPDVLAHLGEMEFESALGTQLLSISPNVTFTVPYLQTTQGCEADIRRYLPNMIYWSYQFKPTLKSEKTGKRRVSGESTLEMGLTKGAVDKVAPSRGSMDSARLSRSRSGVSYHKPSYKSVSEHPFTSAFLLLKANTNEMRAALADFRSRAGLVMEDNNFFFKSAKVAADYRLHLQNVFNKYKQFEMEDDEEEEEEEERVGVDRGESEERTTGGTDEGITAVSAASVEVGVASTSVGGGDETAESGSKIETGSATDQKQETRRKRPSSREGTPPKGNRDEHHRSPVLTDSGGGGRWRGTRTGTFEDIDRGARAASEEVCPEELGYDEIWLNTDQQTDCLDPIKHQGISVLFSNTCGDRQKHQPRPCLPPW